MLEIYFFNVNESSFNNTWLPMIVLTVKHMATTVCERETRHMASNLLSFQTFTIRTRKMRRNARQSDHIQKITKSPRVTRVN